MFRLKALALVSIVIASSCSSVINGGDSTVSLRVALPAYGSRDGASRTIPANLDGMYIQAVDGETVVGKAFATVGPNATDVRLAMSVPAGTYSIHAFATRQNCIVGMAIAEGVTLKTGKDTDLSLTMTESLFSEPAYWGDNPGIDLTYSLYFNDVPWELYPYFLSGTTRLYAKRHANYSNPSAVLSWNDATESFPAATDNGDGFHMVATIPQNTFATNEAVSLWFVTSWPGCPVVFACKLPQNADRISFNW